MGRGLGNPRWLRDRLIAERGGCELCGVTHGVFQVHHKVPRRLGGTDEPENLMLVCRDCHFGVIHATGRHGIHTWAVERGHIRPEDVKPYAGSRRRRERPIEWRGQKRMTVAQAARMLRVSGEQVTRWLKSGELLTLFPVDVRAFQRERETA